MARSTYYSLLEDLRRNDVKSFRGVLESEGLPQDEHWFDYDLLVKAVRLNRKRMVGYLLDKRCRVNKPERLGTEGRPTPLHLVAEKLGWCGVIEKMLRLKARVTDVDADGNTPLHVAFLNRLSDRAVNLLLRHYMVQCTTDIRNKDGLGFMHIACTRSEDKSIREFFDTGMSDIYSQVLPFSDSIWAGYSPLHFAVAAGKHEIVQFLCQYEADVYAQDRNGSTPLHLALEKRDAAMIDILCYYDSKNENYVNAFGVSHFMAACAGSDANVVQQYLEVAEADQLKSHRFLLNGRVKDIPHLPNAGYTPLHFACEFGRAETVHGLLQIGAGNHCAATTTMLNLTPYDLAAKQQNVKICYILEQYYCYVQQLTMQQQQPRPSVTCGHDLLQSCQALQIVCA